MKLFSSRYAQIGLALILAVLLLAAVGTSASAAAPVYHTVQHGQTLYSIAQHYHTSVWAIACANGLYNPNYVYAGQVLVIPSGYHGDCKQAPPTYHHPKKDPCCDNHVSWKPDPNPCCEKPGWDKPKHDPCCEKPGWDKPKHDPCCNERGDDHYGKPKLGCYHTVKWGERLFRIALKYNLSWTVLARANDLHNGNYIYAGQVLRVPCVVY
jgi:membrane-bound lytic murein transglycosylase D